MSEQMNNATFERSTNAYMAAPKSRLDKKGVVILVFTAIISLIFIIAGIVSLSGAKATTLTLSRYNSQSVEKYEDYSYKFSPTQSGYYYFYIEGGSLQDVEDEDGDSVSYTLYSTTSTSIYNTNEKIFKIYLNKRVTYTFETYATDTYLSVMLSNEA